MSHLAVQPKTYSLHWGIDFRLVGAISLTVIAWASAFAGIRVGLESYSPTHLALLRYLTATLALGIYALLTRMPLPQRRDLPAITLLGVVGIGVYNISLNRGEQDVSAGVASLIIASAPIFVALLAGVFLKERLTGWAWLGIAVCFMGVTVIALNAEDGWQISASALLILVAAVAQSIYSVGAKPFFARYSPVQFATYTIWASTAFLLIFFPGLPGEIKTAAPKSTFAVVYMGIVPGAIGYISWAYVLSKLPASRAGTFLYLVPASAIFIAWLWLGELPTLLALVGGALILVGVIVVNKTRLKK